MSVRESRVYKILPSQKWPAPQGAGTLPLSGVDEKDGFVHLSTAGQLPVTLVRHFSAIKEVVVLEFAAADLGDDLRWETNAAGETYPHLYGALGAAHVQRSWNLGRDDAGVFILPEELQ